MTRRMLCPLALAAGVALGTGGVRAEAPDPDAPPPYRDRIIAPDRLAPLADDDEDDAGALFDGPPRSLRTDLVLSRSERGDQARNEQGIAASGFWESASLGAFSLDAGLFHGDRTRDGGRAGPGWGGTATLWQRNVHVDGGWQLDNGLGVLNTPTLRQQREQYRFFLPSAPFAGASTEWRHAARGVDVMAAYGRAGAYTGMRALGFEPADGRVASLGAQWRWSPEWNGAAAFLGSSGRVAPGQRGEALFEPGDTRAVHLSTGRSDIDHATHFNVLGSDTDRGRAHGAWFDGRLRRGRYRHHYGAYRLEPELAWGAYPILNNAEGTYYRVDYAYGRWQWSGGADVLRPVSGGGDDTGYATGSARYQATSTLAYGGSLNLRRTSALAHSAQLFVDRRNAWGQTRVQIDEARAAGETSWQLSADHAFVLQQGSRLSASLGLGEVAYRSDADVEDETTRTATFALLGSRDIGDGLRVDGSARWTHGSGADAVRGLDLNLGLDWRIAPRWALSAVVYRSQGSRRSPFILDPLVVRAPYLALPREQSVLLTLRYQYEAGRPAAVIGGAPGAAVGGVRGSVFLDENHNGVRDASELPAPNVTVLLDGRYSVRTDSDGRFEFSRVAVGTHVLTVEPDNLPLPWSFESADVAAGRTIEVKVRDDTRVDLGAQRPR